MHRLIEDYPKLLQIDPLRGRVAVTQRGFTLIEVLVAIVILSIGLLGVAKLVMGAVHADDSAYMRGQATQLAYELLDMMRANRPGALANYYQTVMPAYTDCSSVQCNDQVIAALDLSNWQNELAIALPAGKGSITMGGGANNQVSATITVSWDDSQGQWAFGTASANATPSVMTVTLESVL